MKQFIAFIFVVVLLNYADSKIAFDLFAYLGQSLELRCDSNQLSKFTRIQHILPNGSIETLLSNDYLNTAYMNGEIHIEKLSKTYIIRIDPIRAHSAGTYSCQDDLSSKNQSAHTTNMTVHVINLPKKGQIVGYGRNQRVENPKIYSNAKSKFDSTKATLIGSLMMLILFF